MLVLQKRAEVGLLTARNIIISPTDSSQNYGVQVAILNGGNAYVSGVQISSAGQQGVPDGYAFQFYNLGNAGGQYHF